MKYKNLSIVSIEDIPTGNIVPTDNLLELFKLFVQMENICTQQNGIGLAATQLGIQYNLCIILRDTDYEYYLNCEYEGIGNKNPSIEGCLSLRDSNGILRRFEVDRFSTIKIKGQQLKIVDGSLVLQYVDKEESGLYAIVLQHEIDHSFGREKMIDQIGKEIDIF